jgi:hypothetical protein
MELLREVKDKQSYRAPSNERPDEPRTPSGDDNSPSIVLDHDHGEPRSPKSVALEHFPITLTLTMSLPGLTGQSSTPGRCLLDRPFSRFAV